uniref:Envelope protein n=1 Tax=Friend spleen focus-forming virus TaxID=11820 RepID=O92790_FRSFV|nr:envelope protein [Friend spleen focus-forming virus]
MACSTLSKSPKDKIDPRDLLIPLILFLSLKGARSAAPGSSPHQVSPSPTPTQPPPAGTGDRLLNLVQGAYQALNPTNPDKIQECWLCLVSGPPYYEGVVVLGTYFNHTIALKEKCCFYADHTGLVRDSMAKLRKRLTQRQKLFESSRGWFEGSSNRSPWFTTLISAIMGSLIILLLLLILLIWTLYS